ncbi:palmitoyltransferase ZDHHC23-B [Glossina fuscipes]|uniref:Palmitoyltransferase n=1 Tax=Glossina fuscipes TaxID=7396 RepID=A0A9C5Z5G8_9MUSC|nr:palmitoyltransferase ZDHHC23-B [Glossina fuscipes]
MLLTFQDRLRIPWRGGAKQVALDVWFSALMVALVLGIAAINVYTAVIMFLASLIFIGYGYYYVRRSLIRTRIFAFWLVWSVAYMSVLMEFAVPLLEFLPEEHLILVILSCISAYCFWTTYRRSQLNFVMQSSVTEDELPDITEVTAAEEEEAEAAAAHTALLMESIDSSTAVDSSMCNTCHKYVPARTVHCQVCGACILRRDHHSYWLNCCIGQWNHMYYLLGLIFGILALLLCANLTLTAVCHPFLVVRLFGVAVMLPDDCTEVFDEYTLSLSFIVALYALLMTCYMLVALVKQICKISRNSNTASGRRNHANGTLTKWLSNWKAFLF